MIYISFAQVVTYDHFYAWLEDILLPNLRADVWYNGDQPIGQRGFVGDRNGRIMGYAIMRQLRIKKGGHRVATVAGNWLTKFVSNFRLSQGMFMQLVDDSSWILKYIQMKRIVKTQSTKHWRAVLVRLTSSFAC